MEREITSSVSNSQLFLHKNLQLLDASDKKCPERANENPFPNLVRARDFISLTGPSKKIVSSH